MKSPATVGKPPSIIADMGTFPQPLGDVWPADGYYPAIKNLAERYACLPAYPDNTFQPRRSATRGEVAQMLSDCLDRILELIQQQ